MGPGPVTIVRPTRDEVGQIWVGGKTRTHVEGRLHGL